MVSNLSLSVDLNQNNLKIDKMRLQLTTLSTVLLEKLTVTTQLIYYTHTHTHTHTHISLCGDRGIRIVPP